jgi:DNA-binding GntR family transcriptional regulator
MESARARSEDPRPSLVDDAEEALRNWLAPGRHRSGDRLPSEREVATMLGISRGTLRTALKRLEKTGEIVRRQGSGTFVGRVAVPSQLDERLERLEPYSSLAKRRGVKLTATELVIAQRPVGREVGNLLKLDAATRVTTIFRVLRANGRPAAVMFDVTHPSVPLPSRESFERLLQSGQMVLDTLIDAGVAVAFARTRVIPCLVTPQDQIGKALRTRRATAALELEEVIYTGNTEPVAYSRDVFSRGALDVRVMRFLDASSPIPVGQTRNAGRRVHKATPVVSGNSGMPDRSSQL